MRIRNRLIASYLVVAACFIVAGHAGLLLFKRLAVEFDSIASQTIPVRDAARQIEAAATEVIAVTNEHMILWGIGIGGGGSLETALNIDEEWEEENRELRKAQEEFHKGMQAYLGGVRQYFPEEEAAAEALRKIGDELIEISNSFARLAHSASTPEELFLRKDHLEDLEDRLGETLHGINAHEDRELVGRIAMVMATVNSAGVSVVLFSLVAMLISVGCGLLVARSIAQPLGSLGQAASRIAQGDFAVRVEPQGGGVEIRQLAEAFNSMAAGLGVAREELVRAKEVAESANLMKSRFLANVSHEIRTPMNGIIGMTDILSETRLDARQREFLEIIKASAERLLAIINDILDFSKIEAGKMTIEMIPFDLERTLALPMRELAVKADRKGIALRLAIEPGTPTLYQGDPLRLTQVFVNLVDNAVKYTEKGSVTIQVRRTEPGQDGGRSLLHFTVRDTGVGVPADKRRLIFDSFTQADGSSTRRYGGTGLGLAISSELCTLMGGRLWLDPTPATPEGGSVFHFTVDCPVHAGWEEKRKGESSTSRGGGRDAAPPAQILLVDDEEINRTMAEIILTEFGWRVTAASSGLEALAEMGQGRFDLVLMDVQMPEMNGFEATERIRLLDRDAGRHTLVVAMTANALAGDRERCLEAGMDDYLAKPFRADELRQAVLRVLRRGGAAGGHDLGDE